MSSKTAIIINIDHEHTPPELCEALWGAICQVLQANGFLYSARLFLHEREPEYALPFAHALVESLELHLDYPERRFHRHIKEFYGFGYNNISNLLTTRAPDIERRLNT